MGKSFSEKEAEKVRQQALVHAALAGDQAAFQELYALLAPLLRRRLMTLSPDGYLDDIVQVSIAKAFNMLSQFRGDSAFTSWCVSIGKNEALTERRRLRRESAVIAGSIEDSILLDSGAVKMNAGALAYTDPASEQAAAFDTIHSAIAELRSKEQRLVLAMRLDGLSLAAMSTALGQPVTNIKSLISRGKANVRRILARRILKD